eukprot:m.35315 g.35315  ORF g.35315 m.35315 type:complete len:57 (+) comp11126_c0_seq1:1260-1430(+)
MHHVDIHKGTPTLAAACTLLEMPTNTSASPKEQQSRAKTTSLVGGERGIKGEDNSR